MQSALTGAFSCELATRSAGIQVAAPPLNSNDTLEGYTCQSESQLLSLPLLSFPWQPRLRRLLSVTEETVIARLIHAHIARTRLAVLRVSVTTRSPPIAAERGRVTTGSLTIATIAAAAILLGTPF